MHRSAAILDSDRHWRRFCRRGSRISCLFSALWLAGFALLFRVAPAPEPEHPASPSPLSWWPAGNQSEVADIRTIWTPSVFALSSPAGFSHVLRKERSRILPPVQSARPEKAFLPSPANDGALDMAVPDHRSGMSSETSVNLLKDSGGVFPPRTSEKEVPRMSFPDGWESRLFSGIDLNFDSWTHRAWSARIEMQFDSTGVPRSMMLTQSSGWPEVDRRLARSAHGWRLLEATAPRTGVVSWYSPGVSPLPPEPAPNSAPPAKGAP